MSNNIFDQFDAPAANPFDQFDAPKTPKLHRGGKDVVSKERRDEMAARYANGDGPKAGSTVPPFHEAVGKQMKHAAEKMIYGGLMPMINSNGKVGGSMNPLGGYSEEAAYPHKQIIDDGAAYVNKLSEQGMPNIGGGIVEAVPQVAAAVGTGGVSVLPRALGQGLTAAAFTHGDGSDRMKAGASAAGGELLGTGLMSGLSRMARPINPTEHAKTLINNGIYPTWGGAAGGASKSIEDKLMSIPFIGDFTAAGRRGAIKEYNAWVMSQSGVPIKPNQVGSQGHQIIGDHFRARYPEVLRNLRMDPNDPVFKQQLNDIVRNHRVGEEGLKNFNSEINLFRGDHDLTPWNITGARMPKAPTGQAPAPTAAPAAPAAPPQLLADQNMEAGLRNSVLPSTTPNFTMPGYVPPGQGNLVVRMDGALTNPGMPEVARPPIPTLIDGEGIQAFTNQLRLGAKEFRGPNATVMDNRTGHALDSARRAVFDTVERQGMGDSVIPLRNLNQDYNRYQVSVRASDSIGAANNDGIFSPEQGYKAFRRQARENNSGTALREGRLPGQEVHQAAMESLGRNYPDSGTAGRLAVTSLLLGGGSLAAPGSPLTVPLAVTAGFANTPFGRKYGVGGAYDWQNPVADFLRKAKPWVGGAGGAAAAAATDDRYRPWEQ